MKILTTAAFALFVASSASAADRMTINECMTVARGIKALDYVGAQIDSNGQIAPAPRDAKQYKLGAMRLTLALNLSQLQRVGDSVEKARGELIKEIFGGQPVSPGPNMDRLLAELQKILDRPCDVTLARISVSDLRIGDGDGENAIPLSVISALAPILKQGE